MRVACDGSRAARKECSRGMPFYHTTELEVCLKMNVRWGLNPKKRARRRVKNRTLFILKRAVKQFRHNFHHFNKHFPELGLKLECGFAFWAICHLHDAEK